MTRGLVRPHGNAWAPPSQVAKGASPPYSNAAPLPQKLRAGRHHAVAIIGTNTVTRTRLATA